MSPQKNSNKNLTFHYKIKLSNDNIKEFIVDLDGNTLNLIPKDQLLYPTWTKLSHHKCKNCPLNEATHPLCPIAKNVLPVIETFKTSISHQEVDVEISTLVRNYQKKTALQNAVSSLIGIYMVTSGCPVMEKLKPMVRTHLPFATPEETLYRVISMYLLGQYFVQKEGGKADWEMKNLLKMFEELNIVNESFCRRLASAKIEDASLNAVAQLDCFVSIASFAIKEQDLAEIKQLFKAYLKD